MERKKIQVGVEYRLADRVGSRGPSAATKVVVMDTALDYALDYSVHVGKGRYGLHRYGVKRRTGAGSMLVAGEVPVYESTKVDPETGEPWTADKLDYWQRKDGSKTIILGYVWVPISAKPRNIVSTWVEYEEELARRKAAAEEQARRWAEEQARRQAEREARLEAQRKVDEERKARVSIQQARYAANLVPLLPQGARPEFSVRWPAAWTAADGPDPVPYVTLPMDDLLDLLIVANQALALSEET